MGLRDAWWVLVGLCVAAGLAGFSCGSDKAANPPPDDENGFSVEAETFTEKFDAEDSEATIQQTYCSSANNYHVVSGMDKADEWIELAISVPDAGLYDVTVRYSAPQGRTIVLRLTSEDCGGEQEPEFTLDKGQWVG